MGLFETEVLTQPENLSAVMDLCGQWIHTVHQRKAIREIILDLDSSVSETYGEQEGSAYNGHFGCTCYHPLFCFNQFGDLERVLLRNGNVASAEDWRSVLEPVVDRYRPLDIRRFFRGDAAFARPGVYEYLEEERFLYAVRLPANAVLYREVEPLLTRPVGRPSNKPVVWYHDFRYQAGSWDKPRGVVAKIEHHKGPGAPGLREKLIKIGAKVVTHARYVIFQMAEVAVPKRLFRAILERIGRLRLPQAVPG